MMIKPEQIPDDAAIAASRAYWDGNQNWKGVISAAINAWPGADKEHAGVCCNPIGSITLPILQEKNDD